VPEGSAGTGKRMA